MKLTIYNDLSKFIWRPKGMYKTFSGLIELTSWPDSEENILKQFAFLY